MPKSAVISIGNEILLGKTLNSNLAYLASELALLGLPVEFSLTVKDEPDAIYNALLQCWQGYDVVITTGGLGPTTDDITKRVIADFFGSELVFDEAVWKQVQTLFAARHLPTPQINRNQAMVPKGFQALRNERGTAPGLFFEQEHKSFFALAGVPLEMKFVFDTQIRDILKQKYGSECAIIQRTLHSFGISESALAELIPTELIPPKVNLAWLPQTGRVDLRFWGSDEQSIETAIARVLPRIEDKIWGMDNDTPVSVLHAQFRRLGYSLSVAESCTGGLLQQMITNLAGASEFFLGGMVSYGNDLKIKALKVNQTTLEEYGAVSENCAMEMVKGIKLLTESDCAISVTGVAGPSGGTDSKPVGTVCFGFSALDLSWTLTQHFNGDRWSIRHKAAEFAILHLIKHLQGCNS